MNRNAGVATEMAGFEVGASGVGLSEGEKMLDRRKFIQQELAKYADMSKMSANDLLRANVLLNSLKTTELTLSKRGLEVDKERRQTLIDTQRDFQKSLIGAGPGELLRKLAESQLAGRNGTRIRTAGQFFSLTGQSQRDVYGLMGGEQMAALNAEARALRGRGNTVAGAQSTAATIEARITAYGTEYGKRIFGNAAVLDQASKSLNGTATAADLLSLSFDRLRSKVETIGFGTAEPAKSSPAPSATPVSQAPRVPTMESQRFSPQVTF